MIIKITRNLVLLLVSKYLIFVTHLCPKAAFGKGQPGAACLFLVLLVSLVWPLSVLKIPDILNCKRVRYDQRLENCWRRFSEEKARKKAENVMNIQPQLHDHQQMGCLHQRPLQS